MLKITFKKRVKSNCKKKTSIRQESNKNIRLLLILLVFFIGQVSIAQKSNLWFTLFPNSGSVNQVDGDITVNNGFVIENKASTDINCSQSTNGNTLIYSITYNGSDFDKDGNNDQVTFDLIVKGYVGATYNYSANQNASSVTNYGTQSDVTVINNTWGVFGDFDVDQGESLTYKIENFTINGVNSSFTYEFDFTLVDLIETNGGRDHTMIFGFGNALESFEMDSNKSVHPSGADNSFSVTGTGSLTTATREFAISSLTFNIEINGPDNTVWDVTDYSIFEKGPTMYHNYPVQKEKKTTLPNFSWKKIPRWVAARSTKAFTNQQITDIADNFQLIMLEKANSQGFNYIEDGIENAATRLKAVNPNITTLFYYNTYINYGGYRANIEYNQNAASWSTYENGEIYLFKDLYYWYNQDVEGMRNWWIDTCLEMSNLDVIDGVFIDKIVNPDNNGDVFNSNGTPKNNYTKMLSDLYNQLPSNKLLVGNTLRNERAGGSRALMEITDGSYMERWDFPSSGQSDTEALAVSIQLMREALQKGKMINFQTSPDSATEEEKPTGDAELLAYTKKHVYFPLAVFLIIAEENAYFSYTTGVNALTTSSDLWDTSFIDEFHYFLGEPLGAPTRNGNIYERSFENLDLWLNIETKETVFNWKDKTILSIDDTPNVYKSIDLYPNPVNNTFSLTKNITSVTVFNMLGQKIMSFHKNKKQFDVSNLKSGVFIVKVILQNGDKQTIRFVKK
jgi:hypothetical protein